MAKKKVQGKKPRGGKNVQKSKFGGKHDRTSKHRGAQNWPGEKSKGGKFDKKKPRTHSGVQEWPEEQKKDKKTSVHDERRKARQKERYQKMKKPEAEESDFEEVTASVKSSDGFAADESDSDSGLQKDTRKLVQQQNRKKKKSGGFQSMGLSYPVYKGITRKGYKIPTPIQRKTIPLIMDGKDVVAMARTGSGKTAAFLVPLFERLKTHLTTGARGLIMAPTRELALQTLKFTKELGRFTGLKSAVILGGDSMDEQFAALHENPDIIIATPGRFMHVMVEMELRLRSMEYVVFDEADRLFELGFQDQLFEILQRLPETRQTLLFSATLPKLLVDFAKAGLHDPTLIRLDVDSKLSENLRTSYLLCRSDDKEAILLYLLRSVVKPSEQTVIFVATKHHVEYLNLILNEAGFSCSYSYSALDQTARKINVAKFRARKSMILLVTDLAARGIDIPLLDNVINYNFPGKSKLFIHRVGRVARAGSSGTAYSLVAPDELPFVLDLHLYLGRPLDIATIGHTHRDRDGVLGRIPQSIIDGEEELLRQWQALHDVKSLEKVTSNAYKHYVRSRPAASSASIKRMKELDTTKLAFHPMFESVSIDVEDERAKLLQSMRSFKPRGTIFEVNAHKKTEAFSIMKKKRKYHGNVIERAISRQQCRDEETRATEQRDTSGIEESEEADIKGTFTLVVAPKAPTETCSMDKKKKKKKKRVHVKDEENYLNYKPKDFHTEFGLRMSSFEKDATNATMDITGDDGDTIKRQQSLMKWDRKKKKYVQERGFEPGMKKMKTESGQWISATYKKNVYKDWLERSKTYEREAAMEDENNNDNDDDGDVAKARPARTPTRMEVLGTKHGQAANQRFNPPALQKVYKGGRRELLRKEQIVKIRRKKEKLRSFMKHREGSKFKAKKPR